VAISDRPDLSVPHSDLDILWPVPSAFDVLSLVFSIAEVQRDAPLRIDGEVVFPDGSAVNWRAHRAADRGSVLIKTMEGRSATRERVSAGRLAAFMTAAPPLDRGRASFETAAFAASSG
jgi:hypothetical protein